VTALPSAPGFDEARRIAANTPLAFFIMRNLYPDLSSSLDFLWLSHHVRGARQKAIGEISMADRPMASLTKPLVFGIVAASTLVLFMLIGVASKNAAPNIAQLNAESPAASGSQNL